MKNKIFIFFLTLTAILGCSRIKSAKIISRYYAKSLCTCLFVNEHPLEYCKKIWRNQQAPNYSLNINWHQRTVETSVLAFKGKSRWKNLHIGCYLTN